MNGPGWTTIKILKSSADPRFWPKVLEIHPLLSDGSWMESLGDGLQFRRRATGNGWGLEPSFDIQQFQPPENIGLVFRRKKATQLYLL